MRRALLLAAACLPAMAAPEAPPTPAVPAPAGYRTPDELLAAVRGWADGGRATVASLARTAEGRDVLVASFGVAEGRPSLLIVADPDGDRPGASQLAVELGDLLAAGDPMLGTLAVHLVAVANPDAAEHALDGPAWRGAPVDEDRDGQLDEDPPDDLNGDGLILQMRVPDAAGELLPEPDEPRALRRADRAAGEQGGWRLVPEGRDDDGDRQYNEDGPGGVRLEANWPHRWRQTDPAAGRFQLSEPESRGLADFVLAHQELILVIVLGSEDNLSTPPRPAERPEATATAPLRDDLTLITRLGERLLKGVEAKPRGGPDGAGTFADWAYWHAGLLVLESAVWSPPLPVAEGGRRRSDEARLLAWNDTALGGAGFVPWTPFEHPQLGRVEIGGWVPFAATSPPAGELPALAERWSGFVSSLAADIPRLAWDKAEVRDLGGGVREARITLFNRGGLPTVPAIGAVVRRLPSIRVRLTLPDGAALLAGRDIQSVTLLSELGGSQEFRWLFRLPDGAPPARVVATAPTCGPAEAELTVNR